MRALARRNDIEWRQSRARLPKRTVLMSGHYIHAKQFKHASGELQFLRISRPSGVETTATLPDAELRIASRRKVFAIEAE